MEMAGAPAPLAVIRRGSIVEAVIRGHAAAVDASGQVVASAGDPWALTTLRSSFKPFQAASFVESGAADALGLGGPSIAIAAASHHGEEPHLKIVNALLSAAGVTEAQLRCGAHLPSDPAAAARLLASGGQPSPIHNNCSGKHAAMLATCVHRGWPLDSYLDRGHPLQIEIANRLAGAMGVDGDQLPFGIDGCGLPTFAVRLADFGRALARAARSDAAVGRCLRCMVENPFLVGGTDAFDTLAMGAGGIAVKSGAAAVLAAVSLTGDLALVVKLESGSPQGMSQVATQALQLAGMLKEPLPADLDEHVHRPIRNWVGREVGSVVAEFELSD